ncbi:hypothetical protein Tco_1551537, partial [Tanacetum coccineum]
MCLVRVPLLLISDISTSPATSAHPVSHNSQPDADTGFDDDDDVLGVLAWIQ